MIPFLEIFTEYKVHYKYNLQYTYFEMYNLKLIVYSTAIIHIYIFVCNCTILML